MDYIPGLKKSFIVVGCICLFVFIFILLAYNNSYFKNVFSIKINDVSINARYLSEFSELLFVKNTSEGRLYNYGSESELFYEIPKSDKYTLSLNEYELYDKFGHRDSFSDNNRGDSLKEVTSSTNNMKIERMGKVLYEGPFLSDISNFITEEGRYYFHIYNKSKRKSTPFARVNTMLTFNVLVVDYEN